MEKLEALKIEGIQREENKMCFVSWKSLFFFLLFFHYSFSFALQR
jgi:hypothetical protein